MDVEGRRFESRPTLSFSANQLVDGYQLERSDDGSVINQIRRWKRKAAREEEDRQANVASGREASSREISNREMERTFEWMLQPHLLKY